VNLHFRTLRPLRENFLRVLRALRDELIFYNHALQPSGVYLLFLSLCFGEIRRRVTAQVCL